MSYQEFEKKTCRYCDGALPVPFLELGAMALANNLPRKEDLLSAEFECPLSLTFCPKCYLVQLTHVVPPEKMFSHYLYVSSTTQTFRDHFAEYAKSVSGKLGERAKKTLAVDIGSNDGLLLSCYQNEGMRAVGVDPATNLAEEANKKGLKTLNAFFDKNCVKQILSEEGKAHAVSANNVFAHIHDIQSVCKNVYELLADDGIFVIEFPYLVTMLETLVFDMIYHEHLSYISVIALQYVLNRFQFEIFDIEQVASHGGSLRVFIQKKKGPYAIQPIVEKLAQSERFKGCDELAVYKKFAGEVNQLKSGFMKVIAELRFQGKKISGYGAPAKASTIANFYELNPARVDYIVDDNPLKQGRYLPGVHIPIVPGSHLHQNPTDYVVIFAWNFAKEILGKLSDVQKRGVRFLVPIIGLKQLKSPGDKQNLFEIL